MSYRYLGIKALQGNSARVPQIMLKDTKKVIHGLQFHISHQLRPYSYVKAFVPASQVFGYEGNLGKLGQNTPNHAQGHMKSNSCLQFHISHQLRAYSYVKFI